jgi:hypothetical protein
MVLVSRHGQEEWATAKSMVAGGAGEGGAAVLDRRWEANLNHLGCGEIGPTGLTHPSAPASKPSNPFFPSSY